MKIKFHGQSCFEISDGDARVVVDPFLKPNNPVAVHTADEVEATHVLLTHGHVDHIADAVGLCKRTGAPAVAIVETANWLGENGVEETFDPNLGGTVEFDWGSVRLTPAWHTSTTPKGTQNTPAGLVVEFGGQTIYHLGDTGLFTDLALPARRQHIDVALMCIGGHYTMDRFDGVVAAELVKADQVIPCHYNTFPPIETDAQAFKSDVQNAGFAEVIVLEPGETHTP
jgi:L-ascorbate metabolism protein UlaG (beta-lactamase superfamily)